ncbi:MAG: hypothetical protein HY202_03225 [Nitrospirae bacterium]|nr:hypothetical protein [Nitrospirota bacterium]
MSLGGFWLVFSPPGKILLSQIEETVSWGPDKANLISLLYVRRDNLTGRIHGEVYPIALAKNGEYREASITTFDDKHPLITQSTRLDKFKQFHIYDHGMEKGTFNVTEKSESDYQCVRVLVGTGPTTSLSPSILRFDPMDARVSSFHSFQGGRGKIVDTSMVYYLATSRKGEKSNFDVEKNYDLATLEQIKKSLKSIAQAKLAQHDTTYGEEVERLPIKMEEFRLFDLNGDGNPEAMGQFSMKIRKKVSYSGSAEKRVETELISLMLWLKPALFNGRDQVLLELKADLAEGSWGKGYDLIEVADFDGDGIGEVLFKSSGWEVTAFHIYSLKNGKLEKVFSGAGYGC